jgi:cyclohexyl-isocyanide hydratase
MRNAEEQANSSVTTTPSRQIVMLIFPDLTPLDLIGPYTFLAGLTDIDIHLVWKQKKPMMLGRARAIINPTATFTECPRDPDALFVPGGLVGTLLAMRDKEVLEFLADRGKRAKYVTSVCTGSLLLGCAGLFQGYRATSHRSTIDILPSLGATPTTERVVEDRNRITGAGVTSGIDFGLVLASKMRGERFARMLQLINEYDPQPPFHAGSPKTAGPEITEHLQRMLASDIDEARAAAREAARTFMPKTDNQDRQC